MRSRAGKVRLKSSPEQLLACGILLDESLASDVIDLPVVFGNRAPVEVEIGPGKGGFLLARAARRPEINLLGIEWVRPYALYAADRARRAGLANVRLLCADAAVVFRAALREGSISRVHIYFPDPWPKRRHYARRLIRPAFAADLHQALKLGGWVGLVTDHGGYFRQVRSVFSREPGLAEVPFVPAEGSEEGLVGTNFGRKYTSEGKRFYSFAVLRWK